MLKSYFLCLAGIFVTLLGLSDIAHAKDDSIGLSFDLPPTKAAESSFVSSPAVIDISTTELQLVKPRSPLPPLHAPKEKSEENAAAETVALANNSVDVGLHFLESTVQLPSITQVTSDADTSLQALSFDDDLLKEYRAGVEQSEAIAAGLTDLGSLNFEEDALGYEALGLDDWIFEGGARSLVALTVGNAEGTRRSNGEKTQAYYGHKDPGNGVWNLGTFSYQHAAKTPEEADAKQIKRLKLQGLQLEDQAAQHGIKLSLVEKLNGLDLANQAPLAALGKGGYIERLAEAHRLEMKGEEAIAWARTRAYIDPNTKAWNAPGLGNNVYSITTDQERRISAIDKALRAYDSTDSDRPALSELKDIGLESFGLESSSLESSGLENPGIESFNLESSGLEDTNFESSGLEDTNFSVTTESSSDGNVEENQQAALEEVLDDTVLAAEPTPATTEATAATAPPPLAHAEQQAHAEQTSDEAETKLSWLRIENRVIDRK